MKSMRFLLTNLFILFSFSGAIACYDPWYTPGTYHMFRIYPFEEKQTESKGVNFPGSDKNCMLWQKLTSRNIPLKDIYEVVYEMPLEKIERVYDTGKGIGNNKFLNWMVKRDRELLDFILLAKTNSYVRLERNSRWYYPSMKTGARMTIDEIARKALSKKNKRLRDRYLLQGVRALFSMGKFQECINLWEAEASHLPEGNLMRELIEPYIAGAELRIKRSEKAFTYFAKKGDIESLMFCMGRNYMDVSTDEILSIVCKYDPNSPYVVKELERMIWCKEPSRTEIWADPAESGYSAEDIKTMKNLHRLCLKVARDRRTDNPAMWYYAASYLSNLQGKTAESLKLLKKAESAKGTEFVKESVALFRIYMDAATSVYNQRYESRLFEQLRWLDAKITGSMDKKMCDRIFNESYKIQRNQTTFYWNDMMRRILLTEVCPRMLKAGKPVRALQLANMADNRLLEYVYASNDSKYRRKGGGSRSVHYSEEFNETDYSSNFFNMIDRMGAEVAGRYVKHVQEPPTPFDRFLNERGYTAGDYLNDIAGTLCLRSMQYGKAVHYLSRVSPACSTHLNVSLHYDPFRPLRRETGKQKRFKYDFARRMHLLETEIGRNGDPDKKARQMVEFAIGLRNSFGWGWPLTQYYKITRFMGVNADKRDWEKDWYTRAALRRADRIIRQAKKTATDDNVRADLYCMLGDKTSVAIYYPYTKKGKRILDEVRAKGKCDVLEDYGIVIR